MILYDIILYDMILYYIICLQQLDDRHNTCPVGSPRNALARKLAARFYGGGGEGERCWVKKN